MCELDASMLNILALVGNTISVSSMQASQLNMKSAIDSVNVVVITILLFLSSLSYLIFILASMVPVIIMACFLLYCQYILPWTSPQTWRSRMAAQLGTF